MAAAVIPHGPKGHLLLGNMPEFNRDPLEFLARCAREYGDVVRTRFLYVTAYFLNNPDHIEYVLATNNRNFIKSRSLRSPFFH
ncbi:MAG TPA: cytochrome P450, partial [Pyrinomonadaceae bacterium]|nr:cytochrome P450 [Pyrinomonadaceae bacterium]